MHFSVPPPPHLVCSCCCSSWAGCSTDLTTWEQHHLVEPLKKWFAVRFTAHSCITVRFKTKQEVEKHRMSGRPHSTTLWPYTACRERDRGKALLRVTLDSNLRPLWAGCPQSQRSVRSSWQIQPRCSWHRLAWSQKIPFHPQSAKGRGRQSPYEARGAQIQRQTQTQLS